MRVAVAETAAAVQSASEPRAPEQAPGEPIDYAYLARFTCGNADLEREVLEIFATQTPVYVAQLRTAVTRKNWRETAHAIKGSALAIGARSLAALAQLAERLDIEADPIARERAVTAVAAAADEVCRHIACRFATP
jgi:HPt (histidine-containing phosphotransfer) domain-containing protein